MHHVDRLDGFCLMMKREVFKRLDQQGELNKLTDLSLFDTDILSTKAEQLGYNLAVCRDLFIHHFGTRTFAHRAPAAAAQSRSDTTCMNSPAIGPWRCVFLMGADNN